MRASRSEDMPAVSGFDNVTVAAESGTVRARATASGRSCISDSLRSGAYHLQGRSQTITAEHAEFAEVFLGHENTKPSSRSVGRRTGVSRRRTVGGTPLGIAGQPTGATRRRPPADVR